VAGGVGVCWSVWPWQVVVESWVSF